jgi:hypothetical protein
VGRRAELTALDAVGRSADHPRVLVLEGAAGMGKPTRGLTHTCGQDHTTDPTCTDDTW